MAVYTAQITSDRSPNSGQTERRGEHETPRDADSGRTLGGRTSGRSRTGRDSDRRRAPRTGWVRALTWAGRAAALAALLFLALSTGTEQPAEPRTYPPLTAEQAQERTAAAFADMIAGQVEELTEGRTCWRSVYDLPKGEQPSIMLVRNAESGIGAYRGDVGVVRIVPFKQGWDEVARGDVVWVSSCK